MQFTANDHTLYYEIHGPADGETVIALHHGLGTTRAWKHQIDSLTAAGFRLVTYDRWGYGKSDPRQRFDFPAFDQDVDDLWRLCEYLNISKAHLIGHSDGGTIAMRFALRCPERVNRLVLIAAHIYVEERMDPGIQGLLQAYEQDETFRSKFTKVHHGKADDLIHNWYRDWRQPSAKTWDMRSEIAGIDSPVLVIQGTEDEHATQQHALDIAKAIPGAQLWLVPGGNHMLIEDQPDEFNTRLVEFLTCNYQEN